MASASAAGEAQLPTAIQNTAPASAMTTTVPTHCPSRRRITTLAQSSAPGSDDRVQRSGLDAACHVVAEVRRQHRGVDLTAGAVHPYIARCGRRAARESERHQRNEDFVS